MIVPLKTHTPTTTLKTGIPPMNTPNNKASTRLSDAELAKRIDDLINLNTLARNSFNLDQCESATDYALKQMDTKLAELLIYFSNTAPFQTDTENLAQLEDTVNDSFARAKAQLTSVIMTEKGQGFYTLNHEYAAAVLV